MASPIQCFGLMFLGFSGFITSIVRLATDKLARIAFIGFILAIVSMVLVANVYGFLNAIIHFCAG